MQITEKNYLLGNTLFKYLINENGNVSLIMIPKETESELAYPWRKENDEFDARAKYSRGFGMGFMVHLKLAHQPYGPLNGSSGKYAQGTYDLVFKEQKCIRKDNATEIVTILESKEKYEVKHTITHFDGETAVFCDVEFFNNSDRVYTIEHISSYALDNLSPFAEDDGPDNYFLHRFKSGWSKEGKHICQSIEELSLHKPWLSGVLETEKWGSVGSCPTAFYFPMAVLEDRKSKVFWAAQLACNFSWQNELTRNSDCLSLSGGIADMDFGQWSKNVKPGENFKAPGARLSVVRGDIYDACQSVTRLQNYACEQYGEEGLPVAFNEFCASWAKPSQEGVERYLEAIRDEDIKYVVIDDGWFVNAAPGQCGEGEWKVDTLKFPDMSAMCKKIREAGKVPGIWFEFESNTVGSPTYGSCDDLQLKRNGYVLNIVGRRTFWDFRKPEVIEYMQEKVIDFLKKYGFGYIKVDYNANIGMGCDGAESLGEGLREHLEQVREFFMKMKREIPDLIIENCASGGRRLEPSMLAVSAISSFSDAHECVEIPYIASNLNNLILPRQSLVWAVLRADDDIDRLSYSMAAAFLGRIGLSGDVDKLSEAQWQVVREGIAFYKKSENIIKNGVSKVYGNRNNNMRYPKGTQVVVRSNSEEILVVVHAYENSCKEDIAVDIPGGFEVKHEFHNKSIVAENGKITVKPMKDLTASALLLGRHAASED